jgi:hypothetical protein
MRLVVDTTSQNTEMSAAPLVAVLEVSGAVLSWTVDDPAGAPHLTFTDPARADWLWRLIGEEGHRAVAAAVEGHGDVPEVELMPGSVEGLRRLALGHWLRRWWPASQRDGIGTLDAAILDAEIAVLTDAAQAFFTDDTLDSDVAGLVTPHAEALRLLLQEGDPRVGDLIEACIEIAEGVGVEVGARQAVSTAAGQRDDYALAAGGETEASTAGEVARGTGSITWAAVPPGIFDAAEDTVGWVISASGSTVVADVRADVSGPGAAGIPVRVQSGALTGTGVLDAGGRSRVSIDDGVRGPVTETAAWNHDWRGTRVGIGVDVGSSGDTDGDRDRVRAFARGRLSRTPADAFLAEILAAEADY